MKKIQRTIQVEVLPTPFELAEMFCEFDSTLQADFFDAIAVIVENGWDRDFLFQLQAITDEKSLTENARQIMSQIGEYSGKM